MIFTLSNVSHTCPCPVYGCDEYLIVDTTDEVRIVTNCSTHEVDIDDLDHIHQPNEE